MRVLVLLHHLPLCRAEGLRQGRLLSHFPLQIRGDSPRKHCHCLPAPAPPGGPRTPPAGCSPLPKGRPVDRVSVAAPGT